MDLLSSYLCLLETTWYNSDSDMYMAWCREEQERIRTVLHELDKA